MSDSANSRGPTRTSSTPRALIHKKILETASEMPDAPMAAVADEVSGASTDLVERVLREYGDPAAVESDPDGQTASDGGSTDGNLKAPESEVGTGDGESADTGQAVEASTDGESAADGDASTDGESAADAEASTDGESAADAGSSVESASESAPASEGASGTAGAPPASEATGDEQTRSETVSDEPATPDPEELSEKELAVLEVVAERPTATQQEVADVLGVSRATVSKRASGIEGFDWQRRAAFVERLFDDAALTRGASDSSPGDPGAVKRPDARTDGDYRSRSNGAGDWPSDVDPAGIAARLDRIEDRLERLEPGEGDASGGIDDPGLAHKVVHACMESDHVDEDEELQVVAAVLHGDPGD